MSRTTKWWIAAVASLVFIGLIRFALIADDSDVSVAPGPGLPSEEIPDRGGKVEALPRETHTLPAGQLNGLAFEDVTARVGLDAYVPQGGEETQSAIPTLSSGLAVTRLDGVLTVLVTSPQGRVALYQYRNASFRDRTRALGLAGVPAGTAAAFADIDGDGDDDLLIGHSLDLVVSVWRNDDGVFVEAKKGTGVKRGSRAPGEHDFPDIRGFAFGDVNGDGYVDFVMSDVNRSMFWGAKYDLDTLTDADEAACTYRADLAKIEGDDTKRISQTHLYLGGPGGTFTDATTTWGLSFDTWLASTPQLVDLDGDGRLDLTMTGMVCGTRVFLNDGDGFSENSKQAGVAAIPQSNGSVIRDLDGDGAADWFVTGPSFPTASGECPPIMPISGCAGNTLLRGNGDGTFTTSPDSGDLSRSGWGMGAAIEDFANTGELQVAVTNGFTAAEIDDTRWGAYWSHFVDDPMSFFVRDGDGAFTDIAAQVGLDDTSAGRALAAVDYDEDGRLDLLVNTADDGLRLYRNTTRTEGRHWVRVALRDTTTTNRSGWGAKVTVTPARGKPTTGWITSNTSYQTQTLPELHVGLGAQSGPVRVEVWWPGSTSPQVYADVDVDRRVVLRR